MKKNEIARLFENLEWAEQKAIEMKYEGFTYKDISRVIGFSAGSIGNWFYEAGKLYGDYEQYVAIRNRERLERRIRIKDLLEDKIFKAIKTVDLVLEKVEPTPGDAIRLRAAMLVLDKFISNAETKIDLNAKVEEKIIDVSKLNDRQLDQITRAAELVRVAEEIAASPTKG